MRRFKRRPHRRDIQPQNFQAASPNFLPTQHVGLAESFLQTFTHNMPLHSGETHLPRTRARARYTEVRASYRHLSAGSPAKSLIILMICHLQAQAELTASFSKDQLFVTTDKKSVMGKGDSKVLIKQNLCIRFLLLSANYGANDGGASAWGRSLLTSRSTRHFALYGGDV